MTEAEILQRQKDIKEALGDDTDVTFSTIYSDKLTTDPTAIAKSTINNAKDLLSQATVTPQNRMIDRRVRIRPKSGAEDYVYGDTILSPGLMSSLRETNGMLFPSTPTINETHSVQYSNYAPTHSIAKYNSYDRTENVMIQVSGDFYVTNASEARYVLSCIHFLRSVTKMDFGASSKTAGTPPPVLLFSAYGNFMYNDVPVIIKTASFTLAPDVDYIQVPVLGNNTDFNIVADFYRQESTQVDRVWVPTKITFAISLEQQITPEWLVNKFNLNSFKRGDLLTKGGII